MATRARRGFPCTYDDGCSVLYCYILVCTLLGHCHQNIPKIIKDRACIIVLQSRIMQYTAVYPSVDCDVDCTALMICFTDGVILGGFDVFKKFIKVINRFFEYSHILPWFEGIGSGIRADVETQATYKRLGDGSSIDWYTCSKRVRERFDYLVKLVDSIYQICHSV